MGRLRAMAPRVRTLVPRVASAKVAGETRGPAEAHWRAWYKTRAWQRLRWQVLVDALFTCARCGRSEHDTRQLVADHKVPHRGDARVFWDKGNLQCLCVACHAGAKQREESGAPGGRGGSKS